LANGDVISQGDYFKHIKLIDAKSATDNGVWVDCRRYDQASIHVSGITTATVIINASNAASFPGNSSHEVQRASLSADGEIIYEVLPAFIKARISAWTSGATSVFIILRSTGGSQP